MNAVDRERLVARFIKLLGGAEEVDEDRPVFRGKLFHRAGVELDVHIVLLAVGDVRVLEVFLCDRREEHEPWRLPCRCTSVDVDVLMKLSRSFLNFARPAGPANDSLNPNAAIKHVGLFVLERVPVIVEMSLSRAGG